MTPPTVLHVTRDWVRPSEGFVSDVVRTTTATRAAVACGQRWPGGPAGEIDVPVHDIGRTVDRLPTALLRRFPALGSTWAARQRALRGLLTAVAIRERATMLHAHFGYWAALTAPVAERLRRPWVVSLHGHDLLVEAAHDPAQIDVLRRATLVVVPSTFLGDVASDLGIPDELIRVLPSGVDLSRLSFRTREPRDDGTVVVTFAGRFVEKKGVLDAARAMAAVRAHHPQVRARFVGHGPLGTELRRTVAELGLPVEIIDGARPGAVLDALVDSHLVVTPSRTADDGDAETLGLVNLEAQACGIPVVTTRHGAIPSTVTRDGAELVAEGDVEALAAALEGLVTSPARWPEMGRAGRRHVALRFELGACVADLEEQYLHLIERGLPAPAAPRPRTTWPGVTVVVPTYNRRELLERTLDALAAQTYPAERCEVVVVDDGSTDGTAEMLAGRTTPGRLTALRNPVNSSAATARNRGVAAANGEIVAFTDDDCRPVPTWLEAMVAGMRSGVDVVQGRTRPDPAQPLRPLSRSQWTLAETGLYETCNVAYTRAVLDRMGPAPFRDDLLRELRDLIAPLIGNHGFAEDTELAWRVRREGGTSRFSAHATVYHHVFAPDPMYLMRRAAVSAGFPILVREIPELREALWHRYLLSAERPIVLAALIGAGLAIGVDRRWATVTIPYLWRRLRPTRPGRRDRLRAAPVLLVRDALQTAALVYGSVRARRLVL